MSLAALLERDDPAHSGALSQFVLVEPTKLLLKVPTPQGPPPAFASAVFTAADNNECAPVIVRDNRQTVDEKDAFGHSVQPSQARATEPLSSDGRGAFVKREAGAFTGLPDCKIASNSGPR